MIRVYYSEANWERYRRTAKLAQIKGVSTNDIALAYVLNQAFPTCAIIGPNSVKELHSSANALHVSLTKGEIKELDLRER
jgi:aryl-alcohol dehydrogenase-like predicted oxidoreductase